MKLIFESAKDDDCVVATVATQEQAMREIRDFCEKRDFEIRYFRAWKRENVKYFDVGSWYERFRLELEDGEIWQD